MIATHATVKVELENNVSDPNSDLDGVSQLFATNYMSHVFMKLQKEDDRGA